MISLNKSLQLLLATALTLMQVVVQAEGYIDQLDLPAKPSALASVSPLLDVTTAGQRLVAVGQRGHILYSDDVGNTWHQALVPVSVDLNAVFFPSTRQGWAVGNDGVILHSEDGGASWVKQLDGRVIGDLLISHYGALARAEPDHEQWARLAAEGQRLVEEGADKPFLDVWFENDLVGYAVGAFNLILGTRDGGLSWTPLQDRTDNPNALHLNAISSTGDALYIAGEQGLLLKWDPFFERFVELDSPYQGTFFGVVGQPGEVLIFGLRGHVFRSLDGGQSWAALDSGLQVSITAAIADGKGRYRLFAQTGQLLLASSNRPSLKLLPQQSLSPVSGAALTSSGAMIVVGTRGLRVLSAE